MCRWKDRLSQLPPSQRQTYLAAEENINRLFEGSENLPQAQALKMHALDSAWVVAVRPPEGVANHYFDDSLGLWLRH